MALQSFKLDPAGGGGISQAAFDAHTHKYRRIEQIGIDDDNEFGSPIRTDIIDDAEVIVGASYAKGADAIGVTVATQETEVPT